ncbi:DNA topoisomerase (ATP-hydrolyzing) subunit A [Rickettsia endosymbiont of Cardiosporidium cionae]|uniref:DNA topoisomerase (ATP-hydrolyzing) subunit A n=1 Tax=Rickettsia endosymbiont of Cardiosporidium cionae TaxID=2777155 RepID=UPI001894C471|nr:DNA topoisomerase (ATP-hydrolyzing) subunit A [Rickettsia endosymbiont of Cardiosporidium cionae]KAF8818970.1 DNA topoisomerase (ATP-hydrolyzing) subunit A [Rickettsia endosymbiont of Cardiosporidium cionae]
MDDNLESTDRDILPISFETEMQRSYMDYAMSVIISRAIPDVRDGLKPVHRRILFAMHSGGYSHDKSYKKSARIVGDVIGKYHPHGDVAVYDALVRMAQEFSLRIPLVDGQGNFGSVDGDAPAAMRYTESRLAKISSSLLSDIDKDTVDFTLNYDDSEYEPRVLPSVFPNLLVNGSGGIAVGMATNIPTHNIGEVIDACLAYIDNHDIDIIDMLKFIKGPDFPTGGVILGAKSIQEAYLTGKSVITCRGRCNIENNADDKNTIIITEIPYMVNKSKLIEKIADLVKDKKIVSISDIRDESNKDGIRVVIEMKKYANPKLLLNQLYSYTPLQSSFGITLLALDKNMPKVMNIKEIIAAFIEFREEIVTKRSIFLLNKSKDRAHLLVGLMIAINNLDLVISIIRNSASVAEAKSLLLEKFWDCTDILDIIMLIDENLVTIKNNKIALTEHQIKAILDMKLQRLTMIEKNKLEEELRFLKNEISKYINILSSRDTLLSVLKSELLEVKEKFNTSRLTEIYLEDIEHNLEDLIEKEDMVVTVTHSGYIKRVPLAHYKSQKRGGKGRAGLLMKDEDITTKIFVDNTHSSLLFFSNIGKVYSLKFYKLPLGNLQSRGQPIINLLPLQSGEKITTIMPLPQDQNSWDSLYLMFVISSGLVRRNALQDFTKLLSSGKIAISLENGEKLVDVKVCNKNEHVFLATRFGKAIRFPVNSIRVFKGRTSRGIKGIKLVQDKDAVISMEIIQGLNTNIQEREAYLSIPFIKRIKFMSNIENFGSSNLESILKKSNIDTSSLNLEFSKILEMAQSEDFILTIGENGIAKSSSVYEYRVTSRGGQGVINMSISKKTGQVALAIKANIKNEIMIITNKGQVIRSRLDAIRATGRVSSGVKLFNTDKDNHVASASLIEEDVVNGLYSAE